MTQVGQISTSGWTRVLAKHAPPVIVLYEKLEKAGWTMDKSQCDTFANVEKGLSGLEKIIQDKGL